MASSSNKSEELYRNAAAYRDGLNILISRSKAFDLFHEAAQLGHIGAITWLALLSTGSLTGSKNDPKLYKKWSAKAKECNVITYYEKRANNNDIDAQYTLGVIYEETLEGIKLDYYKALEWYKKAAYLGFPPAQNNYALLLKRGLGTPINDNETFIWYEKAASKDYVIAQNNLGHLYKNGRGVPLDLSKAFYWFNRAAEIGYASAQKNIGDMYRSGEGVEQNLDKAEEYYKKSAEQNYPIAMNSLGVLYQEQSIHTDPKKAFYWYTKAAKYNVGASEYNIYLMYLDQSVPGTENLPHIECVTKALEHLGKSIHHTNPSILGMQSYGLRLLTGNEVNMNIPLAIKWLIKSSVCGLHDSIEAVLSEEIGKLYLIYFGVLEMDIKQSSYPFAERAKNSVSIFICNNISLIERELPIIDKKQYFYRYILLLKAILPYKNLKTSIFYLKPVYKQFLSIIKKEYNNIDKFTETAPPIVESLSSEPYYELSIPTIVYKCLYTFIIKYSKDFNNILYEDELLCFNNENINLEYNNTLDNSLNNIKKNIIGIKFDKGKPLYIHKELLENNKYFKDFLINKKKSQVIHLQSDLRCVILLYISYMYKIKLHITNNNLKQCLNISHKYKENGISINFHKFVCNSIMDSVTWDDIPYYYDYSKKYSDDILKAACIVFSYKNLSLIINAQERRSKIYKIDKDLLNNTHKYLTKKLENIII